MIMEYLDCKDNVKWKLLQLITTRKTWYINLETSSVVRLYHYKSDDCQMCNEHTNNSQIKLPNQTYHKSRSPISVITDLTVLPVHGIIIHTAQYMFPTLCELHAVPLHSTSINVNTHANSKSDYERSNNMW